MRNAVADFSFAVSDSHHASHRKAIAEEIDSFPRTITFFPHGITLYHLAAPLAWSCMVESSLPPDARPLLCATATPRRTSHAHCLHRQPLVARRPSFAGNRMVARAQNPRGG